METVLEDIHRLWSCDREAPDREASEGPWPCEICAEDRPYFVICTACGRDACTDCYERVFTGLDFRCMHCRALMTRDYVIRQLGEAWFHRDYFPLMMDAVMKQEHEALPHAQNVMDHFVRLRAMIEQDHDTKTYKGRYRTEWSDAYFLLWRDTYDLLVHGTRDPERQLFEIIEDFDTIVRQLDLPWRVISPNWNYERYRHMEIEGQTTNVADVADVADVATTETQKTATKKKAAAACITGKCPAVSGCRGFLVGNVCGVCATRVCGACRAVLGTADSHSCRREDIEAIELIQRETRPCPRCYAPITKISGCDQMWCVCCQTAFSWTTGEIVKGHVHNPHYFEWRRQNATGGAATAEEACGGADAATRMTHVMNTLYNMEYEHADVMHSLRVYVRELEHMTQTHGHLDDVVRQKYERKLTTRFAPLALRLRYLRGDIDEDQWRRTLQRQMLNDMRFRGLLELVDTWVLTIADLVGQRLPDRVTAMPGFILQIVVQYRAFLDYLNGLLDDLSIMYNFKVPVIMDLMPEIHVDGYMRYVNRGTSMFKDIEPFHRAYQRWA